MDRTEMIERLEEIAKHAVHTLGEEPFFMSLDDGIAVKEAIEIISTQPDLSEYSDKLWQKAYEQGKAAAQPERKGKWIEIDDAYNRISGKCSVCGWEAHLYEDDVCGMPYCPNCGARMSEGEEDERSDR